MDRHSPIQQIFEVTSGEIGEIACQMSALHQSKIMLLIQKKRIQVLGFQQQKRVICLQVFGIPVGFSYLVQPLQLLREWGSIIHDLWAVVFPEGYRWVQRELERIQISRSHDRDLH